MEDAIKYEIFYRRAIQEGVTLDGKEQTGVKETVVSLMNNVPHEMLESARLSEEDIKLGEVSFTEQSNSFEEEIEIVDIAKQLREEEVSNVFETSRGYYIIKRLRNTSMASYDNAIKKAVRAVEETIVIPAYEKLKSEHRIKIYEKV